MLSLELDSGFLVRMPRDATADMGVDGRGIGAAACDRQAAAVKSDVRYRYPSPTKYSYS